jgi:WD40 repeat protein
MAVFKFADPISVGRVSSAYNMLFTASWDKMIRCIDLEENKVVKSFIASKEAIKCMQLYEKWVFVAGCDPIIRAYNLETGEPQQYQGHKGWVYCIETNGDRMYSGGDDRSIIIWNIKTTKMLE